MFVLWDGRDLYSKTGRTIVAPHFTDWLPPAFALVGELYLGNGHRPFFHTVALGTNRLPDLDTLPPGTSDAARPLVWRHARFVAFDVPGLVPAADWPYRRRYALLLSVVAAWSRRQYNAAHTPAVLPLQAIRQYPMSEVPALFREVVEGTNERRRPGFGIPEAVVVARHPYGRLVAARTGAWIAASDAVPPFLPGDPIVPGEGLMLYRQSAEWAPRGSAELAPTHGRPGDAVFKFKPTLLTVGASLGMPPCGGGGGWQDGNDDGEYGGEDGGGTILNRRSVRTAWWDPWLGSQARLRVFLAPGRRPEDFAEGARIFFTFVFYDERPMYTRAIGPVLPAEYRARLRRVDGGDGKPHPGDDPDRWPPGTVRALFPVHFRWNPDRFGAGLSRRDHAMRNTPSPFVVPDPGFHGGAGTVARNLRDRRSGTADRIARDTAAARGALRHSHVHWLRSSRRFLGRSLVCACFVLRAWADRTGRPPFATAWWVDEPTAVRGRPYTVWGPFRLVPAAGGGSDPRPSWVHGMVRVLLTVLASVWIRIGGQFGAVALRGLSAPEGAAHLNALGDAVRTMIDGELRPRWEAWRDHILPPASGADLFGELSDGVPNLAWFARSVFVDALSPNAGGNGGGPASAAAAASPPWEVMWGEAPIPPDDACEVDAAELHRTYADRGAPANADRAAAYRTLGDQQRHWRASPDAVLLDPETAIPIAVSDLADRVAAIRRRTTESGVPPTPPDPWVSIRTAAARRLDTIIT